MIYIQRIQKKIMQNAELLIYISYAVQIKIKSQIDFKKKLNWKDTKFILKKNPFLCQFCRKYKFISFNVFFRRFDSYIESLSIAFLFSPSVNSLSSHPHHRIHRVFENLLY